MLADRSGAHSSVFAVSGTCFLAVDDSQVVLCATIVAALDFFASGTTALPDILDFLAHFENLW